MYDISLIQHSGVSDSAGTVSVYCIWPSDVKSISGVGYNAEVVTDNMILAVFETVLMLYQTLLVQMRQQ